jgi:hypothetical protein
MRSRVHLMLGITLALQCLACSASVAWSQSLVIDTIEFKLGMAESEFRRVIDPKYKLVPMGQTSFVIMNKDGPPFTGFGAVAFERGKVIWLSRKWSVYDAKPTVAFADEVLSALQRLSHEGKLEGRVFVAPVAREPMVTADKIEFHFGQRTLIVTVSRGRHENEGSRVEIQETLKSGKGSTP